MSVIVSPEDEQISLEILREQGLDAYQIGRIERGEERIVLC
jgi:phosphoribosylaminoimidazole (AIR) synthetase